MTNLIGLITSGASGGLVVDRVRAMARENILRRMEATEAATIAAATISDIDAQIAALQSVLPTLDEREREPAKAARQMNELIIDLAAQRAKADLDNDRYGAIRYSEQIRAVERQRNEHDAELRTVHNRRTEIGEKLVNLQAVRRELERLIVH